MADPGEGIDVSPRAIRAARECPWGAGTERRPGTAAARLHFASRAPIGWSLMGGKWEASAARFAVTETQGLVTRVNLAEGDL